MPETPKIDTDQKALEINLNDRIYGTFAEIGAGQEVARYFFKVGAAAGTIVKTMSAYDKVFSDNIYGAESSGRYVCESRLYKMLNHEYNLLWDRLKEDRGSKTFFAFADTIQSINYQKSNFGQGWLGLRFQLTPGGEYNELVLHARMRDNDAQLQAAAIGILGVNMLYAAYYHFDDPETFVRSLHDHLHDRLSIDMIRLRGPEFEDWDNRILSMYLVKNHLTEVAMFDQNGQSVHASEFLYKNSLMVVRGNFRPPTLVTEDVFERSFKKFQNEHDVDEKRSIIMAELTLENITENGRIDTEDFKARADLLNAMGQMVIVSDCSEHQKLINYLSDYKIHQLGIVIGIREFRDLIVDKYDTYQDGDLLVAFGQLFTRNIKVYVYPALNDDLTEIMTLDTLRLPEGIHFLYRFLIDQELIVEVKDYNADKLSIIPHGVYKMIKSGESGWESYIPEDLVHLIKEKQLFYGESENDNYG
ncbi:TonB-dependent receptor [Membranicola marinus]|uniref:TonB-dependent receptor n=1 Tax=Membranihabitans marinus TaxID=1227546 RepID=A0A953HN44_9BACT|nr:TonB-dependent receptor [Membranihabitans marinus]MBY5958159.1 TonB-dependent receptor [Membranihabitans marinus]